MTPIETAEQAARQAGALLREHFGQEMHVDEAHHHDLKLALDKESQDLITRILLAEFPDHAIYGEEGLAGNPASEHQWIVDPIDGTVNFFYNIPHFCVSIALRSASWLLGSSTTRCSTSCGRSKKAVRRCSTASRSSRASATG
jgi:myo-inositol-1(or 4)-monophosphatase